MRCRSRDAAAELGMDAPRGPLVSEVTEGSPSDAAGMKCGDVVLSLDCKPIRRSRHLPWLASTAGIGRRVPGTVLRNGRQRELSLILGTLPEDPPMARPWGRSPRSPRCSQPAAALVAETGLAQGTRRLSQSPRGQVAAHQSMS